MRTHESCWELEASDAVTQDVRVGGQVEVFSNSRQLWCRGYVEKVAHGKKGHFSVVQHCAMLDWRGRVEVKGFLGCGGWRGWEWKRRGEGEERGGEVREGERACVFAFCEGFKPVLSHLCKLAHSKSPSFGVGIAWVIVVASSTPARIQASRVSLIKRSHPKHGHGPGQSGKTNETSTYTDAHTDTHGLLE